MRLTYRQIQYIREVAAAGSISAACRKLNITQSSVLAAMNVAEDEVGVRLFIRRKGRGVQLTPAGQTFIIAARRFLASGEDFSRSIHQLSDDIPTNLRVGCFLPFSALLIPPLLARFYEFYENCQVELFEGDQAQLRDWLTSGYLDLALTYDIGEEYGLGSTPICKFPTHSIMHKSDPLAGKDAVTVRELADRPIVLLDLPETRSFLLALFDRISSRPKIRLRTRSYETVMSAVANGIGVSVLNIRPQANTLPDNSNLVRLPIKDELRHPTLLVVDPYGDMKPLAVARFIQTLHTYISELGPQKFAVVCPEFANDLIYPEPTF